MPFERLALIRQTTAGLFHADPFFNVATVSFQQVPQKQANGIGHSRIPNPFQSIVESGTASQTPRLSKRVSLAPGLCTSIFFVFCRSSLGFPVRELSWSSLLFVSHAEDETQP
jgi:hypothetical protein